MKPTSLAQIAYRKFLPVQFKLTSWEKLSPFYQDLIERPIYSVQGLEEWLLDRSELEAFLSEAFAWHYIKISTNSHDSEAQKAYHYAVQVLSPYITDCNHQLNQKLIACAFTNQLDPGRYEIFLRDVRSKLDLFQDENINLETEIQLESKKHGKIFSEMTVDVDGVSLTLQKASALLEEPKREVRQEVYHKINSRILKDVDQLEQLFDKLLKKRHQIALNAGFENFRNYRFRELGRFDYTPEDCEHFHESIHTEILPLVEQLYAYRKKELGVDHLRPWDLHVDPSGQPPLSPFENISQLVDKAASCLRCVHPHFGGIINRMRDLKHLDLESRSGKHPGAYNTTLLMSGASFIFMNASCAFGDMRTFLHECGHAVHAYLSRDLPLSFTRQAPSEVAEFAAMGMELLTMDHWDVFLSNPEDLRRAKLQQLENVLKVLPWVAMIDKFQNWLYINPNHSQDERKQMWLATFKKFNSKLIDHSELEHYAAHLWHKQLHLFQAPLYYIEYGMAQLGAIALWQQYRRQPTRTVENYRAALRLGYTRPINEIYKTAGIKFDFSQDYIRRLGLFVKQEIDTLIAG